MLHQHLRWPVLFMFCWKHESHRIGDENATAISSPLISFIATCRLLSFRLMFGKQLQFLFSIAQLINCAHILISRRVSSCTADANTDIIIVHKILDEPDGLLISHLPFRPPTYFNSCGYIVKHDIANKDVPLPNMSEAYPYLMFHHFNSRQRQRLMQVLRRLFPAPKDEPKRVVASINFGDTISFWDDKFGKMNTD